MRQIPSLRAAQAPATQPVPPPGPGARPTDSFRAAGRTPLDADRRLAERLALEARSAQGREAPAGEPGKGTASRSEPSSAEGRGALEAPGEPDGEDKTGQGLTEDEKRQVEKLEKRDAEVRAHEQAHMAAAGAMAQGGPKYTYETGPDGKRYATGGEVNIVMKTGRTPEETIRNAQQVQAAALAPGDPSPTDQQTAAAAARMAQEARQQLAAQSREKASGKPEGTGPDATSPPRPASPPVAETES